MTPKIHILPSDAHGHSDPTVTKTLLDFLPNKVANINDADVVITVVSWMGNYEFNPALYDVKKKLILLDYLEMGWQAGEKDNVLGRGALKQFGHLDIESYAKLDQWVKDCPPALTFKRELFERDRSKTMLPCEWLCYLPSKPLQSKEQFDARVFDFINVWGLSNPMRQELHGDVFKGAHRYGYNVLDNFAHEQHLEKRNVVSIYSPWFARTSIENIMRWQRRAKISVSCWGAGVKCFRSSESPVDCIMALPCDNLLWAYEWRDGYNCIRLRPDHLLEDVISATQKPDLFTIYLQSQETVEKYRSENYTRDYVMKNIQEIL